MASIRRRTRSTRKGGKPVTSWQALYRDPAGAQRGRTFPTRAEAETFVARVEVAIGSGTFGETEETAAAVTISTLSVCVTRWQATRRVSAARTVADASLVKRFGDLLGRPVDTIVSSDIRALVAGLIDQGLAPATISAILRTLRSVLEQAVEDGHLASNPAARVKAPRITRPPLDASDVYTPTEATALVAATDERYRAMIAVLVYTGARWSEVAALTRGDVDLLRGRVHVGHRVVEEVSGRTRIRLGGKTRGADRWVPLPAAARQALSDHLASYQPGPDELLFGSSAGTPILRGNTTKRVYRPAVERAAKAGGLEDRGIVLRNLRHTSASLMLAAGLSPLEVAHRLGHSRPSTTLDVYARFIASDDTASSDALDRFIADSVSTSCQHAAGSGA